MDAKFTHSPAARRVAKELASMNYGDLKEVATSMRDQFDIAKGDDDFDLISDWMDFLHVWSKHAQEIEK